MSQTQNNNVESVNIVEILTVIKHYRWSILFISMLFFLGTYIALSFKQPIYNAYAIVKIKNPSESNNKSLSLDNYMDFNTINIKEEIALLKTFYINDKALNTVNYTVQYYQHEGYKKKEIYTQLPINIHPIQILDPSILGKNITLIPQKNGFFLQLDYSPLKRFKSLLFGTPLPQIKKELFHYKEHIITPYFSLTVEKLSNFKYPIDIIINENHRYIYEKIIKKNLHISQIEDDVPLIKISYNDTIHKRAIAYIEALTASFIQENVKNKSEQHNKILQFITNKLESMKSKLDKSEKELEAYRINNKVIQPSEQSKMLIAELSNIDISLSENQLKKSLVHNLKKFIQNNYNLDAIAPSLMELNDKPTLELITELQKSQLQRGELLAEYTRKHPKVLSLEKKIQTVRRKIISNINNLEKHLEQQDRTLHKLKKSYEKKLKKLPTKERELINIQRNYKVSSKIYDFLLERQAENEIAKVATLSNYKVIDKAYGSTKPIGTSHRNILLAASIFGMVLGIILAFLRNALNTQIRYKTDIEKQTNIPIYGVIPFSKTQEPRVEVYEHPNTCFAESYRILRTNLQLEMDNFKTLLISSTIQNEGKNITAANLSAIFDLANYKTIVVDLDMRNPTLDRLFGIKSLSKGVSSYLKGEASLSEIVYQVPHEQLSLIPVGAIPSNPSDLVLSAHLPKLLEELKKHYEYIIINSAPLGLVTDTKHIMQFSDINLLLVRQGFTQKSYINNFNKIAKQKKFKAMGIVFMGDAKSCGLI